MVGFTAFAAAPDHSAAGGANGARSNRRLRRNQDGALRLLDVDMDELELSARECGGETHGYLDTHSGAVLVIIKGEPDEHLLRQRIRAERARYKKVPLFGLDEERGLLREFLSRFTDGSGRDVLMRLVDAPGAFHACLVALKADPSLWRLWERFEANGLRGSLLAWMAGMGVQPRLMLSACMED